MKKRLTTLFIFFLLQLLNAQDYIFVQKWTSENGLPSTVISQIAEDDHGFMWIGTRKGLYVFDGSDFKLIDIKVDSTAAMSEAFFTRIYKDSKGFIWAGTLTDGVYVIDPSIEKIKHYKPIANDLTADADVRITTIYEDEENRVWIGIKGAGFALFNRSMQEFTFFKPSIFLPEVRNKAYIDEILSVHYAAPYLWLGTLEGLIRFHVKDITFEYILPCTPENTDNPELLGSWEKGIRDIVEDEKGLLWLSFWGGGIGRYNPKTERCRNYKFDENRKDANTVKVIIKNKDELWGMASGQNGLFIFNKEHGTFRFFEDKKNTNFDFSGKAKVRLFLDSKGGLWFWSNDMLCVYQPQYQIFTIKGVPFKINDIQVNPTTGTFWLSEFLSPNFIRANNISSLPNKQSYEPIRKKSINFIHNFLFASDGRIFAQENTDIFVWDKQKETFVLFIKMDYPGGREAAGTGMITSFIDSRNTIWGGTKVDGIFKINTQTATYELFKNIPEKDQFPIVHNGYNQCFFEDSKGRIWNGSEAGFGYYDYTQNAFVNYPFKSAYTTDDANYSMQRISSFCEDKSGRIWISSNRKGIGYIQEKEDGQLLIKVFSKKDGLRSDKVYQLLTDLNGDIWLSTAEGLSRFRMKTEKFENYGNEYGITEGRMSLMEDGNILLANEYRYFQFHPDSIIDKTAKPVVYLREFNIFDKPFRGEKQINLLDKVELTYQQNFFSLAFGAINFFNPEWIEFAYKLEGINKNWSYTKDRKYASYTSLPAGDYTFQLKARIENEAWSDLKELRIIIIPPFWQTNWFYTVVAITIGLLIYAFYAYRFRQIRAQEAIKSDFSKRLAKVEMTALRAQMNPHFLFNSLNSIKLFIVEKRNKEASHYLSQFAKLIRLVLQNSGLQFVSLADDLEALRLYVEMEKVRFEIFEYEINVQNDIDVDNIKFPPLLLQPYVENAIWHGLIHEDKANKLSIDIKKENDILICIIEDNGIGRAATLEKNKSRLRKSMGMKITKERITLTNELYQTKINVQVIDLKDEKGIALGTRVVLTVDILAE